MRAALVFALLVALWGCGGEAVRPTPPPTPPTAPDAVDEAPAGRLLVTATGDPDAARAVPATAVDAAGLAAMGDALAALGAGAGALDAADPSRDLLAAFDLGECAQGEAQLVLADGVLSLEGRTSDGVCDAIDHEVQVWAVPWADLPDEVQVGETTATRPGG